MNRLSISRKLKKPRRVMLLVKAGSAVQSTIDSLIPLLEPGDIIIDGGNSEFTDSNVSRPFPDSSHACRDAPRNSAPRAFSSSGRESVVAKKVFLSHSCLISISQVPDSALR